MMKIPHQSLEQCLANIKQLVLDNVYNSHNEQLFQSLSLKDVGRIIIKLGAIYTSSYKVNGPTLVRAIEIAGTFIDSENSWNNGTMVRIILDTCGKENLSNLIFRVKDTNISYYKAATDLSGESAKPATKNENLVDSFLAAKIAKDFILNIHLKDKNWPMPLAEEIHKTEIK